MEAEGKNEKIIPTWVWVGIIAAVIVIITCIVGWCNRSPAEGSFTIINSIFSGLAFVMLIIAIFMQRDELQLQRKDLELQREEMTLTRGEFEKQNKTLSRQRFENTFFQLLQRQTEIRGAIKLMHGGSVMGEGLNSFKKIYQNLQVEVNEKKKEKIRNAKPNYASFDAKTWDQELADRAIEIIATTILFQKCFVPYENDLGHYYRHLISLIRFTVEMKVDVDKERYYDFIKSELSQFELLCLFYYGLSDYGRKELKEFLCNRPVNCIFTW